MHHYDGMMQDPANHRERFVALWKQIAEHYKDLPPEVAFELLNEPQDKLTAEEWNRDLAEVLAAVRPRIPRRDVVIGPVHWNAISELNSLKLPEGDRHLIVTVHYYLPFHFTHQGTDFVGGAKQWLGTKWTGTPAEKRAITRDFDAALAWAVAHHRPIYLGEFGSYERADMESRARWTRFVADEALRAEDELRLLGVLLGLRLLRPEARRMDHADPRCAVRKVGIVARGWHWQAQSASAAAPTGRLRCALLAGGTLMCNANQPKMRLRYLDSASRSVRCLSVSGWRLRPRRNPRSSTAARKPSGKSAE